MVTETIHILSLPKGEKVKYKGICVDDFFSLVKGMRGAQEDERAAIVDDDDDHAWRIGLIARDLEVRVDELLMQMEDNTSQNKGPAPGCTNDDCFERLHDGRWVSCTFNKNPSDEEVLKRAAEIKDSVPVLARFIIWDGLKHRISYVFNESFDYDPENLFTLRLQLMGMTHYLPIPSLKIEE